MNKFELSMLIRDAQNLAKVAQWALDDVNSGHLPSKIARESMQWYMDQTGYWHKQHCDSVAHAEYLAAMRARF